MHETKIIFHGADDETDADFEVFGKRYNSNGSEIGRMRELEAFFNEMNRTREWDLKEHIKNIEEEEMYTIDDRIFLLFLATGVSFHNVEIAFKK